MQLEDLYAVVEVVAFLAVTMSAVLSAMYMLEPWLAVKIATVGALALLIVAGLRKL